MHPARQNPSAGRGRRAPLPPLPPQLPRTPRPRPRGARPWWGVLLAAGLPLDTSAATPPLAEEAKLPPAAQTRVDFDHDIKPILTAACLRCHGTEQPKGRFSLVDREAALKGGNRGVDIVVGQSAQSPLIHYVARVVPRLEMPPNNRGTALTPQEVGLLRAWIDQGANWSVTNEVARPQFSFSPTVRSVWVDGNRAQFRQHQWMTDGLSGGIERFEFKETLPHGRKATVEGHLIPNQDEYRVAMTLERKDLGFARMGFQEARTYGNDTGGYYPGFNPSLFTLNRDLRQESGKAWADLGLALPRWPRFTVGYEYQFKEGAKPTLQWGAVTDAQGNVKNVAPSAKEIEEAVHIVKLDANHEYRGVRMEDSFRGEFYDLNTSRQNVDTYYLGKPGPDKVVQVKESERHFQADNALRFEKQIAPWWLASMGYLYTHHDGTGAFQLDTLLTPFAVLPPATGYSFDYFWQSPQIILGRQSHVFNANSLLGPWQGLTFSGGVQCEWMTQHGFGEARLDEGDPTDPSNYFPQPARLSSDQDRFAVDENFGLRYTQIPATVLFAEARLRQEQVGQYEELAGGYHDFLQNTDVASDRQDYRAGFTVSPWQRVSLTSHYRRVERTTDYDHLTDLARFGGAAFPNDGYPAFIRHRQTETDEVETKLAFRPTTWLKTSLGWKYLTTDYSNLTDPVSGDVSPGGNLSSGKYDAHVYSGNVTLTPWRRVYLSTTIAYSDTRTATLVGVLDAVAPYRGDVYSVIPSVTYILSEATDLNATYSFSRADYSAGNATAGLPLGIVYDWHALQAGVTHRFRKHYTANLQYAFYRYAEPSSGGFNDYTAHGVFATLAMRWP